MKLVVQIPCLNEEHTLPLVLRSIPKRIPGISEIVVMVIDDGSTDNTVDVARAHGVRHFVSHTRTRGLGRSFHDGVQAALELGADIVVNTDGDNQYPQSRIADLVQPIIAGKADIVIADRQVHTIEHFSRTKIALQRLGSWVVNLAAGTQVPDAGSGFRAYSRESLLLLNTVSRYSYCTESVIQAGNKKLQIASIPIRVNPKTRESRLFRSTWRHVLNSAAAIVRAFVMYRPYMLFASLALVLGTAGIVPFVRWGVLEIASPRPGNHLESLFVGGVLLTIGFLCLILGIVADLVRTNRALLEDSLEHMKRMRYSGVSVAIPDVDETPRLALAKRAAL